MTSWHQSNARAIVGSVIQAWDAGLDDIAALAVTDGNFIVGDGANWVAESGNTARTSLGLGTGDSPQFASLTVSKAGVPTIDFTNSTAGQNWQFTLIGAGNDVFAIRDVTGGNNDVFQFLPGAPDRVFTVNTNDITLNAGNENFDFIVKSQTSNWFLRMDASRDRIAMGNSPTDAKVNIYQTGAANNYAVILLSQADDDEPFVKLAGTSSSGDLTKSLVDASDVSSATPVAYEKVEIEDSGPISDGDYYRALYSLS